MKHLMVLVAAFALSTAGCEKKGDEAAKPGAAKTTASKAATPASKAAAPASKAAPATKAAPVAAAPTAGDVEAKALFAQRCVTCHGTEGKGDGPAGGALNPKPRDWTDKAWQAKTDDAKIAKAITDGGPAIGLSPLMPPNPDLKAKPAVVKGLVKMIRGYAK
jgi:mono/diheme cytochrome c family protein